MAEELVLGVKLRSESELNQMGYVLMDDEEFPLENNLQQILNMRKMTAADLAREVGVTRQSVSFIIRSKMRPGVDFALKAAEVLEVKIEDMFSLTDGAWVQPVSTFRDHAVYLEMKSLEIVGSRKREELIEENGFEYIRFEDGELLTKEQMDEVIHTNKTIHQADRLEKVREESPDLPYNKAKAQANILLNKELNERYGKLYKRIGENFRDSCE